MNTLDKLRYLNSADGPNIPIRTLAVYCGVSDKQMCNYINGKTKPQQGTVEQLERGVQELSKEIQREVGS